MPEETLVSIVRHGHVHNPRGLYYGRMPLFPLSDEGREQVSAAARALAKRQTAVIFTSPLLRARQTAVILRDAFDMPALYRSKLLTEVRSPFDGRPADELELRRWDVYTGSPPEYEQPSDILRRARRFLWVVRTRYAGKRVVAVTHGDLIALLILWARSAPATPEQMHDLTQWGFPVSYPGPASITELRFLTAAREELPRIQHEALA